VLAGLKHFLGAEGYDLLLFSSEEPNAEGGLHSYARRARHHRVDGVVVLALDDGDDPEVQKLLDAKTPMIAVDLVVAGDAASYVASDNLGGARMAVRHLHDLGHERIATIVGLAHTKPAADRLLGYRAEIQELGLPQRPEYEAPGDFYFDSGEAAMRHLLALKEPPTAVFAASDMMAVGAIKAIEDAGLRCPDDIAVVGFDDIQLAELVSPALTTISQDKRALGVAAARSLVQLIDDADAAPHVSVLPVDLVVRQSCGAGKGGGAALNRGV
jgi:LacI family transcriptional regulator